MLLGITEEEAHNILCGRKRQSMSRSLVCVAMNSGAQTIGLHILRQVLQPLLSDSVQKSKHPHTNRFALVGEGGVALLTVVIFVLSKGGDDITGVHSSRNLTHDEAQQKSAQHTIA